MLGIPKDIDCLFQNWYETQQWKHPHFSPSIAKFNDINLMHELINLAYQDSNWFKHSCFHQRVSIHDLQEKFHCGVFFSLEKNSTIVACAYLEPDICTTLSLLSVHPEFQHQGCARFLMYLICNFLPWMWPPCASISLSVVSLQKHLISIYQKFGFQVSGEKTWKEVGVNEEACISIPCHLITMIKSLNS
ncbi:hypothetical protein HMI54_013056 [Coelomomyces lativittatus]|nr:hypothetical protein HMI54_013056 [Coelomomyces lativittatus]KAJ1515818.1 hypothetical protein HMI56_000561 [Coelomomyces lativittatus]